MSKLVSFVRNDRRPVFINPAFVIAVEPFREDITHSLIFTSGIGRAAQTAATMSCSVARLPSPKC